MKPSLKDLVLKLIPSTWAARSRRRAGIFPMQNVFVRKVKVLKPKFDLVKLAELHSGEGAEDSGDKAEDDEGRGREGHRMAASVAGFGAGGGNGMASARRRTTGVLRRRDRRACG